jgi:hypothetical protein
MWATLACAATLALLPDQGGDLALKNDHFTLGYLGSPRPDNKYLPGDVVYLAYDIENITVAADGRIRYRVGLEVRDPQGKTLLREDPAEREAFNTLGGTTVPAVAQVDVGPRQPAGEYTLMLTVTDVAGKATKKLERKFEVLKPAFGLVRLGTSADPDEHARVPPVAAAGSFLFANFSAVGFERDPGTKLPKVRVEMRVLDDDGQPTVSKPFTVVLSEGVPEKASLLAMQFSLSLNRPGRFTVEFKATDLIGNKIARMNFPVAVVKPKW